MPAPVLPNPGQIVTACKCRHVVQRVGRGAIPEDPRPEPTPAAVGARDSRRGE